jgi:hypothetical protein
MKDKTHLYQRLEGKRHGTGLYAVAIGAVCGGILYHYDMRLPLIFDILTLTLAVIAVLLMQEPERIKEKVIKNPFYDMAVTLRYALYGHKEIAGIILVSTVLFCTTKMVMWAQQPFMQYVDIPVLYFGYIMAAGFLFGGLLGHFGHRFRLNLSNRIMLLSLAGFTVSMLGLAIIFHVPISIICLLMVTGVWGYGFPFVQNAINKYADPARRATILSTLGFLISLMFIPTGLILGWIEENFSILEGLAYIAVQLIILSAIGFYLWHKGVRQKEFYNK